MGVEHEILADGVEIFCGDCREIIPALGAADSLITDPPYGVNIGKHQGAKDDRIRHLTKQGYSSYEDTPENFASIVVPAVKAALAITKRGMVFGVPPQIWGLPAPDAMGGIFLPHSVGRHKWGFSNFAHCLLYGTGARMNHGCRPTGVQNIDTAEKNGHPTAKPLGWMTWAVNLGSSLGDIVLDPFMGSGTTGVACVSLGRKFCGIELDETYFDIARRRISSTLKQGDFFVSVPKKPKQISMLAEKSA